MLWCSLSANSRRIQVNKLNNIVVNLKRNLQLICWTGNDFFLSDTIKMNS